MRAIIDRFEEDKAIIEVNGEMLTVPKVLFGDAQEGDHVEITVLGKPQDPSEDILPDESSGEPAVPAEEAEAAAADKPDPVDDPRAIFERLRARRRHNH